MTRGNRVAVYNEVDLLFRFCVQKVKEEGSVKEWGRNNPENSANRARFDSRAKLHCSRFANVRDSGLLYRLRLCRRNPDAKVFRSFPDPTLSGLNTVSSSYPG